MAERRVTMSNARRPWTPPRQTPTGQTRTMKRACNGCGARLGDVTRDEVERAVAGLALPDVRGECPYCTP